MQYQVNTALFVGSFDPFHEGHLHLLKLAQNNFKKIIIVIANNENKHNQSDLFFRKQQVSLFLKQNNFNIEIITTNGMVVDLCKKIKVNILIRGYRNYQDFQYEKKLEKEYKKSWKSIKVKLYKAKKFTKLSSHKIKPKSH